MENLEPQALPPGTKVRVNVGALGMQYTFAEFEGKPEVQVTCYPVETPYFGTTVAVVHRRDLRAGQNNLKIVNDETGEEMMYMFSEGNTNRQHIEVL